MFRTTLKGLLAHKRRMFTTALAVTLGVAFMAGTLVLTDTIGKTFDDLFGDVYKNTDAVVRAEAAFEGPMSSGAQRGRVDESLVASLRRVSGVAVVEGQVQGYARLVGKDGKAIGNPQMGAPTFGGNWSEAKELNPFTLVAGQPPGADNEVVIDKKSAEDGKLAVGDTTTVLVQGPPQQVRIAGIAKFGTADSPGGASFTLFTGPAAQRLVAEPGKFDSIALVAVEGVSQPELVSRLTPVLPGGVEAVTGAAVTTENQDDLREGFSFFNTFLLVFAVVALLVGGFMIFNTFSITVAQRTRENGLLRALGASRRQILSSVLVEATAIGVVASALGLAAGIAVAGALKGMLAAFGFDIPGRGVVLSASTVVTSVVAGMVVTLVAALSPARKAAKIPPIAAMRAQVAGSAGYGSKQRILVGLLLLVVGVSAMLIGLFGDTGTTVGAVGLGVLLVFFGVSVLGRTISLPLSRALGSPLPRLRGAAGTLARENAMRNPKRTAASASALMIGVGIVGFITILASSTKASIDASTDRAVTGDFVVDSGAGMVGGIDPGMAGQLNALPEVAVATGLSRGFAEVDGSPQMVAGLDPKTAFELLDVKPIQGSPADLGRDAIGVFGEKAEEQGLKLGDRVPVVFKDTGPQSLRVALIYDEDQPVGSYILGVDAFEANFANRYDAQVFVKKAEGASTAATRAAVERVAGAYAGAEVFDQEQFKAEQGAAVDQVLGLVYALLALAIIIALMGIGNTLALSIFERTRELGLLRAVGMTRKQLRSTIRWESVIIAVQGTVLGLLIGVFFGWALVTALTDEGIDQFDLPVGSLAVVVVLAAIAGVVAAVGPSRRAANLNVLGAIASE
ncbi:MAG TPA: FtsX-like permease family protein [Acidimicrobiales bacterium]|nr:FtsX-like permease family protein [Acidimicrobiales bacterium]